MERIRWPKQVASRRSCLLRHWQLEAREAGSERTCEYSTVEGKVFPEKKGLCRSDAASGALPRDAMVRMTSQSHFSGKWLSWCRTQAGNAGGICRESDVETRVSGCKLSEEAAPLPSHSHTRSLSLHRWLVAAQDARSQ